MTKKNKVVYASDMGKAAFCPHALSLEKNFKPCLFSSSRAREKSDNLRKNSEARMLDGTLAHNDLNNQIINGAKTEKQSRSNSSPEKGRPSSSQKKQDRRCFIACYALGDSHPITIELRNWRDDVLLMSVLGRAFTGIYYGLSPMLIYFFGSNELFRSLCARAVKALARRIKN